MYNNDEQFQKYYPTIWSQVIEQNEGQIQIEDGLFTFASTSPIHKSLPAHQHLQGNVHNHGLSIQAYVWKIVSFVSDNKLKLEVLRQLSLALPPAVVNAE